MRRSIHYNPLEDDNYGEYVHKKKQKLDVNTSTNFSVSLSFFQSPTQYFKHV